MPLNDPTIEEVMDKTRNEKRSGKDSINAELIIGEERHKKIFILIKMIWVEENLPEEWENGDQHKYAKALVELLLIMHTKYYQHLHNED